DYAIIKYSCGSKLCDQLFIEHKDGNVESIPVSEGSMLLDYKQNNNHVALLFGRNEGSEVLRNKVEVIDLHTFEKVPVPSDVARFNSFDYPIPSLEWEGNSLILSVADIKDKSFETVKKWYENQQQPVNILTWNVK
ncbi:hypothetical protein RZN22_19040, partial [Bacillaceae bacterium S4-13-58]